MRHRHTGIINSRPPAVEPTLRLVQSTGQWGEWAPQNSAAWPLNDAWQDPHRHRWVSSVDGRAKPFGELTGTDDLACAHMKRAGKKAAGRELDGQIRDEFPHHLAGAGHGATDCTI